MCEKFEKKENKKNNQPSSQPKNIGNEKTRYIFCGDKFQSIYGFAGVNSESINDIIEDFKCVEMPLSICYRCPKSHIKLAQKLVKTIKPFDKMTGYFWYFPLGKNLAHIGAGDYKKNHIKATDEFLEKYGGKVIKTVGRPIRLATPNMCRPFYKGKVVGVG